MKLAPILLCAAMLSASALWSGCVNARAATDIRLTAPDCSGLITLDTLNAYNYAFKPKVEGERERKLKDPGYAALVKFFEDQSFFCWSELPSWKTGKVVRE